MFLPIINYFFILGEWKKGCKIVHYSELKGFSDLLWYFETICQCKVKLKNQIMANCFKMREIITRILRNQVQHRVFQFRHTEASFCRRAPGYSGEWQERVCSGCCGGDPEINRQKLKHFLLPAYGCICVIYRDNVAFTTILFQSEL